MSILYTCQRDVSYKLFTEFVNVGYYEIGSSYQSALVVEDDEGSGKRMLGVIPVSCKDRFVLTNNWFNAHEDSVARRMAFIDTPDRILLPRGLKFVLDWNSDTSKNSWTDQEKQDLLQSLNLIGIKEFVYERSKDVQCSIPDMKVIDFLLRKSIQ